MWKLEEDTGKYFPKLPLPQQASTNIYEVIDYVKQEISRFNYQFGKETDKLEELGANVDHQKIVGDRLPDIWEQISTGFLARNLLNLTSTFAVCKNWNSHSARVGAAVCQLGGALPFLQSAAIGPYIDRVPGGHPFGNSFDGT